MNDNATYHVARASPRRLHRIASLASMGNLRARDLERIKPGKKYTSPLKNFSVTATELCLGTKIQKAHERARGMVAFVSDVGQPSRLDYVRLSPEEAGTVAESDSDSKGRFYAARLEELLRPNGVKFLVREPLRYADSEMLFALAEFPGGAAVETVTMRDGQMSRVREDSVRGLLAFVEGGFFCTLHHDLGIHFDKLWPCVLKARSGPHLSPEERIRSAKEGIWNFHDSISFE